MTSHLIRAGLPARAVAAAIAFALVPILATAPTASAAAKPPRAFQNLATGLMLDSNLAGKVYTLPWNNGAFQKWIVTTSLFNAPVLQNLATGFCLDSNLAGKVYTLPCNGGSFQKWSVKSSAIPGTVTLRDLATGFCLDSNQLGMVYAGPCNGGAFQTWWMKSVAP